jgi:DNA-binding MarR family transcriptional regulator
MSGHEHTAASAASAPAAPASPVSGTQHEVRVDDVQRQLRRVLRALRRRRPVTRELSENFRKGRLGPRHAAALAVITDEEGLTVGDIARRLGVSLAAASQIASELTTADLVQRTEDQGDRRRTRVALHEHRRHVVRDWLDERAQPVAAALARLDPDERAAFVRGLTLLAEELEAAAPPRQRP